MTERPHTLTYAGRIMSNAEKTARELRATRLIHDLGIQRGSVVMIDFFIDRNRVVGRVSHFSTSNGIIYRIHLEGDILGTRTRIIEDIQLVPGAY